MDFELSEEVRQIRDTFARYVDERLAPRAAEIDEAHEFPREAFDEIGALGFFRMLYPEDAGGLGLGMVPYCLAVEELARGSMSVAGCVSMQSLMATYFLNELGNDDIKARLFEPALDGKKIGAICMTEPNAGSDLHGITTRAVETEGGWALTGQKMWVTSAPVADFFTVFAKAGDEDKLTIFLVERDSAGLSIGRSIDKMGVWAMITSEISFDECFVPDSHKLCEIGEGETRLRKILTQVRVLTGALGIGIARAAMDAALTYAGERHQFGRPINSFQAVQLKLAEMGTDLEAARHLVLYAAWLHDTGRPNRKEAAMAKLFASEKAAEICDKAARIYASYGYAMEYPIQRYLRDVRFLLIGGGTSDILKITIARDMSRGE